MICKVNVRSIVESTMTLPCVLFKMWSEMRKWKTLIRANNRYSTINKELGPDKSHNNKNKEIWVTKRYSNKNKEYELATGTATRIK